MTESAIRLVNEKQVKVAPRDGGKMRSSTAILEGKRGSKTGIFTGEMMVDREGRGREYQRPANEGDFKDWWDS